MPKIKADISINDIKRCYVKANITIECPLCKGQIVFEFEDHYLSYPKVGEMDSHGGCCNKCETWFIMPIEITKAEIEIKYYPKKIKED